MTSIIDEAYIQNNLINNDSLFNYVYVIEQNFDIIPNTNNHYGATIEYQDITELRKEFLNELYSIPLSFSWRSPKFYPRSDRDDIAGQGEGLFAVP